MNKQTQRLRCGVVYLFRSYHLVFMTLQALNSNIYVEVELSVTEVLWLSALGFWIKWLTSSVF